MRARSTTSLNNSTKDWILFKKDDSLIAWFGSTGKKLNNRVSSKSSDASIKIKRQSKIAKGYSYLEGYQEATTVEAHNSLFMVDSRNNDVITSTKVDILFEEINHQLVKENPEFVNKLKAIFDSKKQHLISVFDLRFMSYLSFIKSEVEHSLTFKNLIGREVTSDEISTIHGDIITKGERDSFYNDDAVSVSYLMTAVPVSIYNDSVPSHSWSF